MPGALVTGAHGFVGRQLCRALVNHGWRVSAGYRRSGSPPDMLGVTNECLPLSLEPERWQCALRSIDCVVHLAAHVHQMGREGRSDAAYEEINVAGSRFVAEMAARAGVKRFVFLSTAKVNGEGSNTRSYRADDRSDPQDAYARSKCAAETLIRDICAPTAMEFVIVRPPLVYGPGVRANFQRLLRLIDRGLPLPFGAIVNRRSLVGVENLVDFIETCMVHPKAAGRVWLVCDGEALSTPDLIRRLARSMGRSARLLACPPALLRALASLIGRSAEMARLCDSFVLDSAPARDLLGWSPVVSADEGLDHTVADYLSRQVK
jgi:UDP-glucose 4-epimerase